MTEEAKVRIERQQQRRHDDEKQNTDSVHEPRQVVRSEEVTPHRRLRRTLSPRERAVVHAFCLSEEYKATMPQSLSRRQKRGMIEAKRLMTELNFA